MRHTSPADKPLRADRRHRRVAGHRACSASWRSTSSTEFRVSIFEQFLSPSLPLAARPRRRNDPDAGRRFEGVRAVFAAVRRGPCHPVRAAGQRARAARCCSCAGSIVLLAFGLIHLCLIWNGDILTEYALAGFIVLPFLFGPRWLLAVAALASLVLYLAMQAFPPRVLWPGTAAMAQDVAEAQSHLRDGRISRRAGLPAPRDSAFRCPARLYLSAHDRVVSSRRVRLARRHSAKPRHAICCSRSPPPVSALARH